MFTDFSTLIHKMQFVKSEYFFSYITTETTHHTHNKQYLLWGKKLLNFEMVPNSGQNNNKNQSGTEVQIFRKYDV